MDDRVGFRNVDIYDGITGELLGGLGQNGSITEAVFLSMLNYVLLITDEPLKVKERGTQRTILPTGKPLELGVYDVYCNDRFYGNEQGTLFPPVPPIKRRRSNTVAARTRSKASSFKDTVEQRDSMCVFSRNRIVNLPRGGAVWSGFTCAKIVPTRLAGTSDMFDASKLNSSCNGLLMNYCLNRVFIVGFICVNPDDDYRNTVFDDDIMRVDGNTLDPVCRDPDDPRRVSDEFLRWHFQQSVLASVRGRREPITW